MIIGSLRGNKGREGRRKRPSSRKKMEEMGVKTERSETLCS